MRLLVISKRKGLVVWRHVLPARVDGVCACRKEEVHVCQRPSKLRSGGVPVCRWAWAVINRHHGGQAKAARVGAAHDAGRQTDPSPSTPE